MKGDWSALEAAAPQSILLDGATVRAGGRVLLRPGGRDVMDLALAGRTAIVQRLEQDLDGHVKLVVCVEDDPGGELAAGRPGHSFFFSPGEVSPLPAAPAPACSAPRVLIAGIGNVFLGDDGFGVALAEALAARELPQGTEVVDYGIRGIDLAYSLLEDYEAVILLDAVPRGGQPGTLYVIEPELDEEACAPDAHGMDPVTVLRLARELGAPSRPTLVLGCEPLLYVDPESPEVREELSEPVQAALAGAAALAIRLAGELAVGRQKGEDHG